MIKKNHSRQVFFIGKPMLITNFKATAYLPLVTENKVPQAQERG